MGADDDGGWAGLRMVGQLKRVALRLVLVVLGTTLCSFLALDQPVLRSVYLAVARYLTLLGQPDRQLAAVLPVAWNAYWRSMILLVGALAIGALVGVALGYFAAARARSPLGRLAGGLSYLGLLTPSFILGLLIMVFFVRYLGRWTGLQWIIVTPTAEIPTPRECLAPILTLAARPVAQIAQVTAFHAREALGANYARTARSKGLRESRIALGHIWPNIAAPVLAATRTSLLFSLSSLPVVEYVFGWNGIGYTLFRAVVARQAVLAAALLAAVAVTLVLINTLVELLSLRIDPRLQLAHGDG